MMALSKHDDSLSVFQYYTVAFGPPCYNITVRHLHFRCHGESVQLGQPQDRQTFPHDKWQDYGYHQN